MEQGNMIVVPLSNCRLEYTPEIRLKYYLKFCDSEIFPVMQLFFLYLYTILL